jgi:hypothetical protein
MVYQRWPLFLCGRMAGAHIELDSRPILAARIAPSPGPRQNLSVNF